jgi:2C-methyl-D-erythritol 2,4-cyclodiphosphate synthase
MLRDIFNIFAVNKKKKKNYFTVIYMKKASGIYIFHTNNWTTNELDTRVRVLRQKLKV